MEARPWHPQTPWGAQGGGGQVGRYTDKGTHSLWRSWKGAGPLSEALSSLSLFMSMGYMEPGSIFTGGGRERKAIEKQGGRG